MIPNIYRTFRWRKLRREILDAAPLCVKCVIDGRTKAATEVDHILPLKDYPDLAYIRSNLQALCKTCHLDKTSKENRRKGFNSYGIPIARTQEHIQ